MTTPDTVRLGRESFGRRRWADAYGHLSAADQEIPLETEDLERLATAAYLLGKDHQAPISGRARTTSF